MKLLSAKQHELLKYTEIDAGHFTREEYLLSCAFSMKEEINKGDFKCITIVCGPCEKGEIGIVLANIYARNGTNIEIVSIDYPNHRAMDKRIRELTMLRVIRERLFKSDLVIDCMISGLPEKENKYHYTQVIRWINECKAHVIACEIPSGIDADSGVIDDEAVKADQTVVFQIPKLGLYLYPGSIYKGKVTIKNSIYSIDVLNKAECFAFLHEDDEIVKLTQTIYQKEKSRTKRLLFFTNERNLEDLNQKLKTIREVGKCEIAVYTNDDTVCSRICAAGKDDLMAKMVKQRAEMVNRDYGLYDFIAYNQQDNDKPYVLGTFLRTNRPLVLKITDFDSIEEIMDRAEQKEMTLVIMREDLIPKEENGPTNLKQIKRMTRHRKNLIILVIGKTTIVSSEGAIHIFDSKMDGGLENVCFSTVLCLLMKEKGLSSIISAAYISALANGLFCSNPVAYFPAVRDPYGMILAIILTMLRK